MGLSEMTVDKTRITDEQLAADLGITEDAIKSPGVVVIQHLDKPALKRKVAVLRELQEARALLTAMFAEWMHTVDARVGDWAPQIGELLGEEGREEAFEAWQAARKAKP